MPCRHIQQITSYQKITFLFKKLFYFFIFFCAVGVVKVQSLELYLEATPGPIFPGDAIFQQVTIRNTGDEVLREVLLQLRQPSLTRSRSGLSTFASPGAGCPSPSSTCGPDRLISWSYDELAPGQSHTEFFIAELPDNGTVMPGTDLMLEARAEAANASDFSTNTVLETGDDSIRPLHLSVISNKETVNSGQEVTQTITFSNGSQSVQDPQIETAMLTMEISEGATVLNSDGGVLSGNGRMISWSLGALPENARGVRQVQLQALDPNLVTNLVSEVELTDNTGRQARARETIRIENTLPLQVTLEATPGPIFPGDAIFQQVTIRNTGDEVLREVLLQLRQPSLTRSRSGLSTFASPGAGCPSPSSTCGPDRLISWSYDELAPGQSHTEFFIAELPDNGTVTPGTILELQARAEAVNASDALVSSNVAVGNGDVKPLQLSVITDKAVSEPGQEVRYTIAFTNTSLGVQDPQIESATLTMEIPRDATSLSGDGGILSDNGRSISWLLGALPENARGVRQVRLQVSDSSSMPNLVSEVELMDNTGRQARARETVLTGTPPALQIIFEQIPETIRSGDALRQQVTIRNTGDEVLREVLLQLRQPSLTRSRSGLSTFASPGAGCPSPSSTCGPDRLISWSYDELAPGQSHTEFFIAELPDNGTVTPGTILELQARAEAADASDVVIDAFVIVVDEESVFIERQDSIFSDQFESEGQTN